MTWTREDDERELRLYVSRKLKGQQESLDEAIEKYRHLWDMLPAGVRRTINTLGYQPDLSRRRQQ